MSEACWGSYGISAHVGRIARHRSSDAFAPALVEYDETCDKHDAEMDGIREALPTKFGKLPLLDTYRQMAVRHQKARNRQRQSGRHKAA
jgi:hypothetical protein